MNRRAFVAASFGLAAALTESPSQLAHAKRRAFTEVTQNFDVAIIGAGLFGSAAARHLSQNSDGVVLIGPAEPHRRRAHQGVFASHYDASRLTRIVDPDLLWGILAKRSVDRYRTIERLSAIPFYHDIGYMMVTPGGLGTDWFDLHAMREVASDLKIDLEDLDDASLEQRFPYLRFTPGSSAVLQRQNAGYLDPRRLVEAQQKIAVSQGRRSSVRRSCRCARVDGNWKLKHVREEPYAPIAC